MDSKDTPDGAGASGKLRHLARLEELPEEQPVLRSIGRRGFLVVRRGEQAHALGDTCPHHGCSLHEGIVAGDQIICPCHEARFDLETGAPVGPPARDDLPVYRVSVENGEVAVGAPRPATPWYVPARRGPRRFLILGAGAAGSAAAEALRRDGFDGRIVMVGAEGCLPYDRTALSKEFFRPAQEPGVLDGPTPAGADAEGDSPVGSSAAGPVRELRAPEFYRAAEIELELGRRAVAVDPAATAVELDDGRTLSYDALLLATGGTPRRLGLPGEHLPGVFTLRSRSDAEALRRAVAASRRVVIVGAGFLGLELAGAARRLGVEVTVVAPELLPLAPPLDEQVSRWVLAQHRARGTEFRLGTMVREIHGPGQVRRVELSDGEILECGALVEAVGIRAESRYMPSRVPAADGSIRTDRRQRTAVEGVYAAGDLAAVVGEGGDARRFEHWTEAEAQGVRAARAMLGREPSTSAVPFFWTEVGELTLKFVGLAPRTAAAGLRSRVRGKPEDGSFVVAYLEGVEGERDGGTSRLVAACGVGRDRELAALGELIRRGLPLEERRFSDESFDLIRALRGSSLGG